jgi:L-xylulokinase
MSEVLIGIDSGLTVTKAVVFDFEGRALGDSGAPSEQDSPQPRWVERDMDDLWRTAAAAVKTALERAGVRGSDVQGVGLSGHGDGSYLVDEAGRPVRPGISSMDSRATDVMERWEQEGISKRAPELTGITPWAPLPAALIVWVREHEPEVYERIRWNLACKDWLRFKLTGEFNTDFTEASTGFTEVTSQRYAPEVFALYGLEDFADKVPPVLDCSAVAGTVTREAASATGLAEGTPVVAGAHDIDCGPVGTGVINPGQLCAITGTWSINDTIIHEPNVSPSWGCRNFVEPGSWLCLSGSPASSANLEWFVRQLCAAEAAQAERQNESPFAFVSPEVSSVLEEESHVFFHPYLYGAPGDAPLAGAFLGIRGWHTRAHLLKALFEGVVFNTLDHIDDLRGGLDITDIRLTGGGSRSAVWCQMYADALGAPVHTTDADEAGALGAAILAGIGTGVWPSLTEAVEATVRLADAYEPDPRQGERLAEAHRTWKALVEALTPVSAQLT